MIKGLRILMLEDVLADAELVRHELLKEKIEFTLKLVMTKKDFLKELNGFAPDIILSDYKLPRFDGMTALNMVQELAPSIPFILVTGSINEETAVECMKAGATDYIIKDNLMRLGSAIEGAMKKKQVEEEKERAEMELKRNYDVQTVLNSLLRLSLEDMSFEELLGRLLDQILSISWLSFEAKGCIFIVEDDPEVLVMRAHKGFSPSIFNECAKIPFGKCFCGRAASSGEIIHTENVDENHEIRFEGITPHGHYCVPIIVAGKTLGVINIVLNEGHRRDQTEVEFLTTVANTLAGIIQRKRTEEEREELQSQLSQSQKMEAIGMLAGGIAHDFNNLLTAIQGHTDLAMMKVDGSDPICRDLKQIDRSSIRAADLTRQLLLFSRKQPMELISIDINKTMMDLLKMLGRLIGENITITTELEPDIWTVKADEGNIEQVIMNISVNARDALEEGGGLTIKTENVKLTEVSSRRITDARAGSFVCLSISDTGTGIDAETMSHIFEPFFSTKEVGKGTGLGLAVVYGIVKQHKGWINVSSELGQGTTFRIYLPASSVKPEKRDGVETSLKELQGKGERILLVEDEKDVREFAEEVLRENGYKTTGVSNVKEAIEVFEREGGNFHLVFSDVVLPDESGLQLVDKLLSQKPNLLVLMNSGYTDEKSQWHLINEKGYPFLQKPYTVAKLLKAVKEVLGKSDE